MKVRELIDALGEFNPELEVMILSGGLSPVVDIYDSETSYDELPIVTIEAKP